jgi:hypothetical protein
MSRHEITYESEDDEEYMEESKRIINVVCSILNEIINNEKNYENKKKRNENEIEIEEEENEIQFDNDNNELINVEFTFNNIAKGF